MCQPVKARLPNPSHPTPPSRSLSSSDKTIILFSLLPFLPTTFYLNRGYTVWYHYTLLLTYLTGSDFLKRVCIIQGLTVCGGWYASLGYEWMRYGRFFNILYDNARVLFDFTETKSCNLKCVAGEKVLTNILDFLAHPFPLLLLKNETQNINQPLSTITAFIISRLWSLTHNIYNLGYTGHWWFWYAGRDVYEVEYLEGWWVAYFIETLIFIYFTIDLLRNPKTP